jgi:hypothetical protein
MNNPVNLTTLKERIPELLAIHREKSDAALKFTAAIEAVSEKTFVDKATLRKAVSALVKDRIETDKTAADELSELLNELHEFAGAE